MKALYRVYNPKQEELGQIWLDSHDRTTLQRQGYCRICLDDIFPELVSSLPEHLEDMALRTLEVITLGLERDRQGVWYLETDAKAAQVEKARRLQEQKMRFPLPVSLFPS